MDLVQALAAITEMAGLLFGALLAIPASSELSKMWPDK